MYPNQYISNQYQACDDTNMSSMGMYVLDFLPGLLVVYFAALIRHLQSAVADLSLL